MERDLENAVHSFLSPDNVLSLRNCALKFGVPRSTLHRHVNGGTTRSEGHASQRLLSSDEEQALKKHICHLASLGWAPSYTMLTYIAQRYLWSRHEDSRYQLGKCWAQRFVSRHTELTTTWSIGQDRKRLEAARSGVIPYWLEAFRSICVEYGVQRSDIYNMDEKGTVLGTGGRTRVIVRVSHRQLDRQTRVPGNRDFVTLVDCVGIEGGFLTPMVICKAKGVDPNLFRGLQFSMYTL
jgi:Tc5 transposase DNA-binding domain/helix-turn-helix, Psq domain